MKNKIAALFLALIMLFSLAACAASDSTTTVSPSADVTAGVTPTEAAPVNVNAGFLKGPTGLGAAYLMEQAAGGTYNGIDYTFTLESDPSVITSSIISGDLDIAAVPTNVAATLYNKTNGNVRIAAINTLGVLSILENGNTINSVADLEGKTIYATGQGANPEYVLNYILTQNGLEPGVDVTIEYLSTDELATKMASNLIDICMLPVPFTTTVMMNNPDVRVALDLTAEWDSVSGGDSVLAQGCIVYRADTVDSATLDKFLESYETSINYMADEANLDAAAELAVKYEIVGSAQIAAAAIPQSNLVFVSGAEMMRQYLDGYYQVLFTADATSIGGAIPGEDFYYSNN